MNFMYRHALCACMVNKPCFSPNPTFLPCTCTAGSLLSQHTVVLLMAMLLSPDNVAKLAAEEFN